MPEVAEREVPYLSQVQLEQAADRLRERHNLATIPIDPLLLAQREGIAVHNARFNEGRTNDGRLVGMIARHDDEVLILADEYALPLRKRYTIAHELGHYVLHLPGDGELVDSEVDLFRRSPRSDQTLTPEQRREVQANQFAAALLMPRSEVGRYWAEGHSIETLARAFLVSDEAMGERIAALGWD